MADYLKNFAEDETILASDTNSNNQYLLDRIGDNYTRLKTWLEGEVGRINSNMQSGDATLQKKLDDLQKSINNAPHVLKRGSNSSQWYEIWSDGICIQGGKIAKGAIRTGNDVKFLIPYKDTNYYIQMTSMDEDRSDLGRYNYTAESGATSNRTKTGFHVLWNWGGRFWEARGNVNLSEVLK